MQIALPHPTHWLCHLADRVHVALNLELSHLLCVCRTHFYHIFLFTIDSLLKMRAHLSCSHYYGYDLCNSKELMNIKEDEIASAPLICSKAVDGWIDPQRLCGSPAPQAEKAASIQGKKCGKVPPP